MDRRQALKGLATGTLAALALAAALSIWPLAAQASPPPQPQTSSRACAGLSPHVIPPAAFISDGYDLDGYWFSFSGGYFRGDPDACMMAPAYLPHGAVISYFYASIYDNGAGNVTVNLRRVHRGTGAVNTMAGAGTVADSTSIQQRYDSTISYPRVEYPTYAYYVTTCVNNSAQRIYSVRIYYAQPVYIPILVGD